MKLVLTKTDLQSDAWKRLKAHLLEKLDDLHKRNELSLDEQSTAKLRGQISEIRYILNLENPPLEFQQEDSEKYD